jgi:hypothetical protein
MANHQFVIVPVEESNNMIITNNMLQIVRKLSEMVANSDLPIFDEYTRQGFWKSLTIRDFVGDCMLIITSHPLEDEEKLNAVQQEVVKTFVKFGDLTESKFQVTSVYWQVSANASDPPSYKHLGGEYNSYSIVLKF